LEQRPISEKPDIRVWDLPVRLYHWLQAVLVGFALLTGYLLGATWIDFHIWAGTAIMALVVARVVWGFLGTPYARFSNFVPGLLSIPEYLGSLAMGRAPRHIGHNPLGAAMILALLLMITALFITGLLSLGGVFKTGPASAFITYSEGGAIRQIHETLALLISALAILHIAGALFESFRTKENLVGAMVSGVKQRRLGDHRDIPAARPRPIMALTVLAAGLTASISVSLALSAQYARAHPPLIVNPTYASECGACHMPFAPTLLPAASWKLLMANLDQHFGEDASLDAGVAANISDWLASHSAESADSKPANRFRMVNPAAPFEITATPFWQRAHRSIPAETFSQSPINSKANCQACHADARSGAFYPGNIDIGEETPK
jgi:cytochrome b